MPERTVTFAELAGDGMMEIGAGRPRTVHALYPSIPVLRVADVLDGRIESRSQYHVQDGYLQAMGSKISRPGDVVLTVKGTVGRVSLMPSGGPDYAYSPQLCYFRPAIDGLLRARYLYYWFKSAEFWNQANAFKGQTDMADYISLSDIAALKMRLPALEQQDGVASLLGALDDKIAVNGRIVSIADQLGAACFEAMLADDGGVSDVSLAEVAKVNVRKVMPASGGNLRYIDISSVGQGIIEWPKATSWETAPGRARRGVVPGDTVWSTVRPNRRSHALILDDDPELVVSTGFAVLTPIEVGPAYLYEVSRRNEFVQYLEGVAEGSAYPAVRAERFNKAPIPLLSLDRVANFEEGIMPVRRRAHAAQVESRGLAELRDHLLPKLMSGEIRVKDAEKVVEDVT